MESNTRRKAEVLFDAEFEPRLRTYTLATVSFFLFITVVGIILIPFWLIFGRFYVNRYYDNLFCQLTTRALHFKKGVWFQTEKTIPLDKIQDLTFNEGPFLRYFGLSYLQVETAGNSAQGMADMSLTGIVDARKFREMVLDQRDNIVYNENHSSSDAKRSLQEGEEKNEIHNDETLKILKEISSTLKRIEKKSL